MDTASKLLPRFTLIATSAAPWLFAFLLVGCDFHTNMENLPALVNQVSKAAGFNQEKPQISLEIPRGYSQAKKAAEADQRTWEQIALDAERMAFHGPAQEAAPLANLPAASALPAGKTPDVKVSKLGKKVAKLRYAKKSYASTGKYWKPAKAGTKKVGYHKVGASKLASTY